MSNPGNKGIFAGITAFLASVQITGNPTVDAGLRYLIFGGGTFGAGAAVGWLNSKGFSGPDVYFYTWLGIVAALFALATMIWGLVKTSKLELLIQLREAIALKAGIAAERHDDPTPDVKTVKEAQEVIAAHAPDIIPPAK